MSNGNKSFHCLPSEILCKGPYKHCHFLKALNIWSHTWDYTNWASFHEACFHREPASHRPSACKATLSGPHRALLWRPSTRNVYRGKSSWEDSLPMTKRGLGCLLQSVSTTISPSLLEIRILHSRKNSLFEQSVRKKKNLMFKYAYPTCTQKAKWLAGVRKRLGLQRKLFLQLERDIWFSSKGRRTFEK